MLLRALALAVLAWIGIDFSDPAVSGVFFLEADQLFVDSVVPAKINGVSAKPHVDPSRHPMQFDARLAASPTPVLRNITVPRRMPRDTLESRPTALAAADSSSDSDPLA